MARKVPRVIATRTQEFVLEYNQVVPKPFCNAGDEYVYVQGPVSLKMTTHMTRSGMYAMSFFAEGELSVTPVNPMTGEPVGPSLEAHVTQRHSSMIANHKASALGVMFQQIGRKGDAGFAYYCSRLSLSVPGSKCYDMIICCGGDGTVSCSNSERRRPGSQRDPGLLPLGASLPPI